MTVTASKLDANRANALKSTGPRDTSLTRLNATTHGFFSREVVLRTESRSEFDSMAAPLRQAFDPQDAVQELFADLAIAAAWRLKRLHRLERQLLDRGLPHRDQRPVTLKDVIEECCRLEQAEKAAARGDQPDQPPHLQQPPSPPPDPVDYEALDRLARYEAVLERSLYRAVNTLMRLRKETVEQPPPAADTGVGQPPPAASDADSEEALGRPPFEKGASPQTPPSKTSLRSGEEKSLEEGEGETFPSERFPPPLPKAPPDWLEAQEDPPPFEPRIWLL